MSLAKHRRCSGEGVGLATLYRAFTAKVFVSLLSMLGVVEQSRLDVRAIMTKLFWRDPDVVCVCPWGSL